MIKTFIKFILEKIWSYIERFLYTEKVKKLEEENKQLKERLEITKELNDEEIKEANESYRNFLIMYDKYKQSKIPREDDDHI